MLPRLLVLYAFGQLFNLAARVAGINANVRVW